MQRIVFYSMMKDHQIQLRGFDLQYLNSQNVKDHIFNLNFDRYYPYPN